MIAAACNTGLRASDLVALRVGDVDLERGYLRVAILRTGGLDWLPITATWTQNSAVGSPGTPSGCSSSARR